MYSIFHNIDGEKTSIFNTDREFIKFVNLIQEENEDSFELKTVEQCTFYINTYCSNLTLTVV